MGALGFAERDIRVDVVGLCYFLDICQDGQEVQVLLNALLVILLKENADSYPSFSDGAMITANDL